jgi:hypothetical protein
VGSYTVRTLTATSVEPVTSGRYHDELQTGSSHKFRIRTPTAQMTATTIRPLRVRDPDPKVTA